MPTDDWQFVHARAFRKSWTFKFNFAVRTEPKKVKTLNFCLLPLTGQSLIFPTNWMT